MRYEMRLNGNPFKQMLEGKKTIEVRLNDAKRKMLSVGDEILFINRDNSVQTLLKKVKNFRSYKTFEEMTINENCELLGFDKNTSKEEIVHCYYSFYSKEEEKEFGVLAIELC